jgi:hypothetical protein
MRGPALLQKRPSFHTRTCDAHKVRAKTCSPNNTREQPRTHKRVESTRLEQNACEGRRMQDVPACAATNQREANKSMASSIALFLHAQLYAVETER